MKCPLPWSCFSPRCMTVTQNGSASRAGRSWTSSAPRTWGCSIGCGNSSIAIHRRGGDGRTPLHCATTVEIAEYLLDRGAAIDARCVDHESTPGDFPTTVKLLIEAGERPDPDDFPIGRADVDEVLQAHLKR